MSAEGFNYDNLFIRITNRLGDFLILSLLFILGCLPIVTIGASITATYYAAMKGVTGDDGYVFKNYTKSFKENFKQATIIWLILLAILFIFGVDLWFWLKQWTVARMVWAKPMIAVSVILLMLAIFVAMYIFPLQSKFENNTKTQFKHAFLLSIKNFPITLLILLVCVVVLFLFYIQPGLSTAGFCMFGFGACAYFFAYLMTICFRPFLKTTSKIPDDDQWSVSPEDTDNANTTDKSDSTDSTDSTDNTDTSDITDSADNTN